MILIVAEDAYSSDGKSGIFAISATMAPNKVAEASRLCLLRQDVLGDFAVDVCQAEVSVPDVRMSWSLRSWEH